MHYKDILVFARLLRKNQTPAEQFFWEKVRNRRLFNKKFNRQFIIEHTEILGKKQFFIADFYCHEKRLIVEIDGKIHLQQIAYDQMREEILVKMEFQVVRFKNEDVLHHWEGVENELRALLL